MQTLDRMLSILFVIAAAAAGLPWGCSCAETDGGGNPDARPEGVVDLPGEGTTDWRADDTGVEQPEVPPDGDGWEQPSCATGSDQAVASPVDIIISIDQSPSMSDETRGVIDNLNTNLVTILASAGLDYRVIFVTGAGGLPSGENYYQCHVVPGVNSSDMLTLLLWTYDGDSRDPNTCDKHEGANEAWKDWLRPDSFKVFIALTDDDPSSFDCAGAIGMCTPDCPEGCNNDCEGWCPMYQCPTYADRPAAWGGEDFPSELYKLLPAGTFGTPEEPRWIFHSIVPVTSMLGPDEPLTPLNDVCNTSGNSGMTSGVEYQKLSKLTGGLRFPSCDTDYSPVFEAIAGTIVPLACKFSLERTELGTPDPDKTNLEIDFGDGLGPQTIPQDMTAPCDGGADGWQWEVEGEIIVLCGDPCEHLKATPDATVTITVGCQTIMI